MYQESKGKGNDPMQSSESLGLKRNEITDPQLSVKQGIKQFTLMYKTGKEKGVDLDTIIQSYNMGAGYIDFVAEHGGTHTEELAKQYSEQQVKKILICILAGEMRKISAIRIATVIIRMQKK